MVLPLNFFHLWQKMIHITMSEVQLKSFQPKKDETLQAAMFFIQAFIDTGLSISPPLHLRLLNGGSYEWEGSL